MGVEIPVAAAISAAVSSASYAVSYLLASSQKPGTQDNARTVDNRVQ